MEVRRDQLPPEAGAAEPRDGFAFNGQRAADRRDLGRLSVPGAAPAAALAQAPADAACCSSMLVVLSLLSFVAVRWVTRPLHRLAQAAEELGRDINHPPLRENGPARSSARGARVQRDAGAAVALHPHTHRHPRRHVA